MNEVTENKVNTSVLDAFDLLKTPNEDSKLNGATKIIFQLQGSENVKDLEYVLKRLVRSLGANVPDMRMGYFATLVTVLTNFTQVNVSQILQLVKKELHANGSSKSEVGDVALGQILVCGAIFRSGLLHKCSDEEQSEVIQLLLGASKKKSYLGTIAHLMLWDFLCGLDEEKFATKVWPHIKKDFKKDIKEHNLDSLYFLMVISKKFSSTVKLRKLIGSKEILCENNIHDVCEKIMTGIDFGSVSHPIYKEIGTSIANSPYLNLFWTSGIDSHLTKHNRNRELVTVTMLTTILSTLTDNFDVIPDLLSRNVFKLFMDWFKGLKTASKIRSKRDNEDDNKIMIKKQKELLSMLAKVLKSDKVDNKVRVSVLKKLLFDPGEINFSEITGTTIVKSIIADLNIDGVKKMAKLFKGVLLNSTKKLIKEGVERAWYNHEKIRAAELMSYLVSHETVKDDMEFKLAYMTLLMCFGFFKIGGDENVAVSNELSGSIKSSFYRCFTSRFSNVDNLVSILSSLSLFICNILKNDQVRLKIEKQFAKENVECWAMLTEVCHTIEGKKSKSKVDNVFLILLYQLGLFLFSEPTHVKIARSSIKELKSCYEHYSKDKKNKSKVKQDSDGEPEWLEVLVEVLLSILSAESSVLRSVVQCGFRLLWEYLTPSSIGQIVSVLDPENESNPLTQDSESENEYEENEEDEEEIEEEGGDKSDEDNSEIEEDNDEDMKTPEQLRLAVQKALGAAAPDTDIESVDADMIDEEEGKKLDEALADAFKQFHQGKGKNLKKDRKDKKALSDFRIRVLDLIDIYLEKDPSMDVCLGMIAPLMRCLELCVRDNQFNELERRVRKTIKTLTKVRKFSSVNDITVEILCNYLTATIDKGSRSHFLFQVLGDVITHIATFIINCSLKIGDQKPKAKKCETVSSILEILKESIQSYFRSRNSALPIIFFHNVLQMEWDDNYELVQIVAENIFNNDIRQFRRNEGVELLSGFYRSLNRRKPTSEQAIRNLTNLEKLFDNILRKTLTKETEFIAKNNFFVILKKLLNTIDQFHKHCNIETNLNIKSLHDIVGSYKGVAKANNKNSQSTSNSSEKGQKSKKKNKKKRKLSQINGHVEPKQKKLKKTSESD